MCECVCGVLFDGVGGGVVGGVFGVRVRVSVGIRVSTVRERVDDGGEGE